MSKQRLPPSAERREAAPEAASVERSEEELLGNAALQASMEGGADLDVVRDLALPIVDHASLVLHIAPAARGSRLVEILERSRLPGDRKQVLLDRLRTREVAASTVREALIAAFGADTPALRARISDLLDDVHAALAGGTESGGAWVHGADRATLSPEALDGPLTDRVGALLRDVSKDDGVRSFCLAVHLALTLDEEEDEEEEAFAMAPEED